MARRLETSAELRAKHKQFFYAWYRVRHPNPEAKGQIRSLEQYHVMIKVLTGRETSIDLCR